MQRSSPYLRNVSTGLSARSRSDEPITEPSGAGAFAEAMRELIDDLETVPDSGPMRHPRPANLARRAAGRPSLRLVRGGAKRD